MRLCGFEKILGYSFAFISLVSSLLAEDVQRQRPAEWSNLVRGGRFMDRFEPMEEGKLTCDVWGGDNVKPRYVDNGLEDSKFSYWGGNILRDKLGIYHAYVCGWLEKGIKGHMDWPISKIYHATSHSLAGPYKNDGVIGEGFNPEAIRLKDGRVALFRTKAYIYSGYYLCDSENGSWKYFDMLYDPRDRTIIDGLSNLSFARREDGSFLMVCRGGGMWISQTGISPYMQISDSSVYPKIVGNFEDPVIWRDEFQFHMIVNDWSGRIAYYERSKDGLNWVVEDGEAYTPGIAFHKDGKKEEWYKYERIKVFQDDFGRAIQANFAVVDLDKRKDLAGDNHSSKNITIPLNRGIRMEVLGNTPIDSNTHKIEVWIKSEFGFDANRDIDLSSLRFGSHKLVNFGKGAKAESIRKYGDDAIITFVGKSGIDEAEFAPKLVGARKDGTLLYGYAKLPYVDYTPSILSSRRPRYFGHNGEIIIEVQNFGLRDSEPVDVHVLSDGKPIATGKLYSLKPYEKRDVYMLTPSFKRGYTPKNFTVKFTSNGKTISENIFN